MAQNLKRASGTERVTEQGTRFTYQSVKLNPIVGWSACKGRSGRVYFGAQPVICASYKTVLLSTHLRQISQSPFPIVALVNGGHDQSRERDELAIDMERACPDIHLTDHLVPTIW